MIDYYDLNLIYELEIDINKNFSKLNTLITLEKMIEKKPLTKDIIKLVENYTDIEIDFLDVDDADIASESLIVGIKNVISKIIEMLQKLWSKLMDVIKNSINDKSKDGGKKLSETIDKKEKELEEKKIIVKDISDKVQLLDNEMIKKVIKILSDNEKFKPKPGKDEINYWSKILKDDFNIDISNTILNSPVECKKLINSNAKTLKDCGIKSFKYLRDTSKQNSHTINYTLNLFIKYNNDFQKDLEDWRKKIDYKVSSEKGKKLANTMVINYTCVMKMIKIYTILGVHINNFYTHINEILYKV